MHEHAIPNCATPAKIDQVDHWQQQMGWSATLFLWIEIIFFIVRRCGTNTCVPLTLLESVAIVGGCGLREGWVLSFGVLEGRFGVGCWIR